MDILYWYYVQSKTNKDMVGNIIKQIQDSGHTPKSRIAVIQQLLQQDIISLVEFDELIKYEDSKYERDVKNSPASTSNTVPESAVESGVEISDTSSNQPTDDIKVLRDRLLKENKGKLLSWLQCVLLECCFSKLNYYCQSPTITSMSSLLDSSTSIAESSTKNPIKVMEPIPHHCMCKYYN